MSVSQYNCIDLFQWKRFRCGEVRHRIRIRCDVNANIDHNSRLVGSYEVTSASDFLIRTKSGYTSPSRTWSLWPVDVQTKVSQQLPSFFCVRFSISTDITNCFGNDWRGPLNCDFPTSFHSNFSCNGSSSTDSF